MDRYTYHSGELILKWSENYLWGWTISTYRVLLEVLPASVGKITFVYSKPTTTFTKDFLSQEFTLPERDQHHWKHDSVTVTAEEGYEIVPGTAQVIWLKKAGEHINASISSDSFGKVICMYNWQDASGIFQIGFKQSKVIPEQERREERTDLRWGNSFMATPENSEHIKKVLFEAFDKVHRYELPPLTQRDNPFITLLAYDGTLTIKARDASELNSQKLQH